MSESSHSSLELSETSSPTDGQHTLFVPPFYLIYRSPQVSTFVFFQVVSSLHLDPTIRVMVSGSLSWLALPFTTHPILCSLHSLESPHQLQ